MDCSTGRWPNNCRGRRQFSEKNPGQPRIKSLRTLWNQLFGCLHERNSCRADRRRFSAPDDSIPMAKLQRAVWFTARFDQIRGPGWLCIPGLSAPRICSNLFQSQKFEKYFSRIINDLRAAQSGILPAPMLSSSQGRGCRSAKQRAGVFDSSRRLTLGAIWASVPVNGPMSRR